MYLFRKRQYHFNKTTYHAFLPHIDAFISSLQWNMSLMKKITDVETSIAKLIMYTDVTKEKTTFDPFLEHIELTHSIQLDGVSFLLEDAFLAKLHSIDTNSQTEQYWSVYEHMKADIASVTPDMRWTSEQLHTFARHATGDATINFYRSKQVWIHGKSPIDAEFVPAHPRDIELVCEQLFAFISSKNTYPPSIILSIAFAFFFLVLPYNAQNARINRYFFHLVFTYLYSPAHFSFPLSFFLIKDAQECNRQLMEICKKDSVQGFIEYFLSFLHTSTETMLQKMKDLHQYHDTLSQKMPISARSEEAVLDLMRHLPTDPYINVKRIQDITHLSKPNANILAAKLVDAKILKLVGQSKRNRVFHVKGYYDIMK